jgi:hypothetical protein
MNELVINDPKWGEKKYLINARVAIHVQEKAINEILQYFPRADWHINELY